MAQYISTKKSQVWTIDLLIAVVMFMLALFAIYQYLINVEKNKVSNIEELARDSQVISDLLLSSGIPENWNALNVKKIGIVDNNSRIDEVKWFEFSQIDYYKTKSLFNTKYNYYIYFLDNNQQIITINSVSSVGKSGVDPSNIEDINTKRLVKVNRLAIYNSKIVRMVLFVWE